MSRSMFACVSLLAITSSLAAQDSKPFTCRDGLQLPSALEFPNGKNETTASRVVILVHGSGSHSLDCDLTSITRDRKPNLWMKSLGDGIRKRDFAVFRYDKRPYRLRENMKMGLAGAREAVAEYATDPVRYHISDLEDAIEHVKKSVPNAKVYLLGHSEGTFTALQAAHRRKDVAGVGLIGFAQYSTDLLIFEQTVYRPLSIFRSIDTDRDGVLTEVELKSNQDAGATIAAQTKLFDQNGDGKIQESEFKAAAFSNSMIQDLGRPMRKTEASLPRSSDIVRDAPFAVAFFQGMLDNQTPAYHAMAVKTMLHVSGKSDKAHFRFFEGLGHALDRRKDYDDLEFDVIDAEALEQLATDLDSIFAAR